MTLRTLYILLEQPLEEALKSKNKDVHALVEMQNNLNRLGATSLVRTQDTPTQLTRLLT